MVRITEKTAEEKELEKKVDMLYKITLKHFSNTGVGLVVSKKMGISVVHDNDIKMITLVDYNTIFLHNPSYFDSILKLAKKYEKATKEEWEIRKEYDD